MQGISGLRSDLRIDLRDFPRPFVADVLGDGVTYIFDLPVEFIETEGLSVIAFSATPYALVPSDYTLYEREGRIELRGGPLGNGVPMTVKGSYYRWFLNSDLEAILQEKFLEHRIGRENRLHVVEDLPEVEERILTLLASIECLWQIITEASYDIDISTPTGVTIPRSQRFRQMFEFVQSRQREYDMLAEALNVGPNRIQMLNLRRISRMTNRFVPIYIEQEYDDSATPQRVRPPISIPLLSSELPEDT